MPFYLTKPLSIPLGSDETYVKAKLLAKLRLSEKQLKSFALHRQSVDARNKNDVHFVCSYVVEATRELQFALPYEFPRDVLASVARCAEPHSCIVVGAGPAGLFAALYLAKAGWDVTVVERGSDVHKRSEAVKRFFEGGEFSPETNVQFGLGGAGTFSDGKLTTGISSPLTFTVFNQLVRSGAPTDILTSAMPHVGTDNLVKVVAALRDEITQYGGRFLFDSRVSDFILERGTVCGVVLSDGRRLTADKTLLACGHSARDLFERLVELGAEVTFKPFAVGLRVEHTRRFINEAQYGVLFATHRDLPAASYKLAMNGAERNCYTFCMCPGGVVVAANSEPQAVVVNGMSNYLRNADNSNSALVVGVSERDMRNWGYVGALAGVQFQRDLEHRAYNLGGGGYVAPSQNVSDFVRDRIGTDFDVTPSYPRGVKPADLHSLFPQPIGDALQRALCYFDGKIRGFGSSGVLTGVESRTSSPVRITRGADYMSNLSGLYPIGEGAGYAGGIVSAAVDGLRVAMRLACPDVSK